MVDYYNEFTYRGWKAKQYKPNAWSIFSPDGEYRDIGNNEESIKWIIDGHIEHEKPKAYKIGTILEAKFSVDDNWHDGKIIKKKGNSYLISPFKDGLKEEWITKDRLLEQNPKGGSMATKSQNFKVTFTDGSWYRVKAENKTEAWYLAEGYAKEEHGVRHPHSIKSVMPVGRTTVFKVGRNPGAAWHAEEAKNEIALRSTKDRGSKDWEYLDGKVQAQLQSAHASEYRGMSNPRRRNPIKKSAFPILGLVIVGFGIWWLVKNKTV